MPPAGRDAERHACVTPSSPQARATRLTSGARGGPEGQERRAQEGKRLSCRRDVRAQPHPTGSVRRRNTVIVQGGREHTEAVGIWLDHHDAGALLLVPRRDNIEPDLVHKLQQPGCALSHERCDGAHPDREHGLYSGRKSGFRRGVAVTRAERPGVRLGLEDSAARAIA